MGHRARLRPRITVMVGSDGSVTIVIEPPPVAGIGVDRNVYAMVQALHTAQSASG